MIAGSRSARETAIGEAMFSQLAGTRNLRQSPNQIAANSPCQCQVCRSLQNATVQRVHRVPSLKQTSSAIVSCVYISRRASGGEHRRSAAPDPVHLRAAGSVQACLFFEHVPWYRSIAQLRPAMSKLPSAKTFLNVGAWSFAAGFLFERVRDTSRPLPLMPSWMDPASAERGESSSGGAQNIIRWR